jgi:phage baseplate assembly protein W
MPITTDPVYLRGWSDPLTFEKDCNLKQVTNEDCLGVDIFSILDERKGEWFLHPQHGTTVAQELFDPNDQILAAKLQSKIIAEVSEQETRVDFGKVAVRQGILPDGTIVTPQEQQNSDTTVTLIIPFFVKQTAKQRAAIMTLTPEV